MMALGIISGVKRLLGGSGKGLDTVKTILKASDGLRFSNEERSEFNLKVADGLAEYAKSTLSENTIRSKARRHIAILIIYNAIVTFWFCVILALLGKDFMFVLEIFLAVFGSTCVIVVLAFFFGGYYLKNAPFINKKEKK